MDSSTSSQVNQPYSTLNHVTLDMDFEHRRDVTRQSASRAKKNGIKEKEAPKDWTTVEEIVLCQAWYDVLKNSEKGNSMNAKGFWEAVINYFKKETGSTRGYDSILSKWKNKVLASKKFEGLGVSSFFALNRALLFKWVWRYLSHDNSLWSRIISALHGLNGHVLSAAFNST
ncbi:hypothetical protein Tco_1224840 [Tanacetum coccineum]